MIKKIKKVFAIPNSPEYYKMDEHWYSRYKKWKELSRRKYPVRWMIDDLSGWISGWYAFYRLRKFAFLLARKLPAYFLNSAFVITARKNGS